MELLVLGGTVFLGRHVVNEALKRGHEVTIFSRGLHGTVHRGRRARQGRPQADLAPLEGRSWDAVVDTSGYHPDDVARVRAARRRPLRLRLLLQRLSRLAGQARRRGLARPPARRGLRRAQGGVASEQLPGELGDRPGGLIVGPHDNVFRLPWWVRRIAGGRQGPRARGPRPADADHRRARPRELPARSRREPGPTAPSTAPPRSARRRCANSSRRPATPSSSGSPTSKLEAGRGRAVDGAPALAAGASTREPGASAPPRRRRRASRTRPVNGHRARRSHLAGTGRGAGTRRLALRAPAAAG